MKKEIGTFERTTHKDIMHDVHVILAVALPVTVILFLYLLVAKKETLDLELVWILGKILLSLLIGGIIIILIMHLIPPDFKYCIILDNGYIIFSYPDKKTDIINKSFEVSKKTLYYLVLKDEDVEVKIPYNRKVLKVLKEIKE